MISDWVKAKLVTLLSGKTCGYPVGQRELVAHWLCFCETCVVVLQLIQMKRLTLRLVQADTCSSSMIGPRKFFTVNWLS